MKKTALATVDLSDPAKPKFILRHRSLFNQDLSVFGDGTRLKITLENYYRQRTLSQNGVLHWYLTELADYLGMEMQDFKSMMGMKFLQAAKEDGEGNPIGDPETGEVLMFIRSTTDLNTVEMSEYTEKIRMWALDFLKYELPLPDANYKIHFLENTKKQKNGK